ncbi:hypothetical protein HY500_01325 [Candidatus Woesearchaeota archaeon]|nr:hypothetical protein [Candidatus Woesearchaeota archaeon]
MKSHKAQFFSADLVLSLFLFAAILVSFFVTHGYLNRNIETQEKRNDMTLIASSVSSLLIQNGGYPENWETFDKNDINEHSVSVLGLSKNADGWNLAQAKINKFIQLNSSYDSLKDILGIKGQGYEFYVNISTVSQSYVAGIYPVNSKNVINVERFALLDGQRARVNLKVWENE